MKHLTLLAAIGLCVLSTPTAAQPQVELLGETNPLATLAGNRFQGLWWAESVGSGAPVILSISSSGLIELHTGSDAGGHLPFQLSEMRGVWRRTAGREAEIVALRFLYNLDGTIRAAVRGSGSMRFRDSFDTLEVTLRNDQFACESIPNPPGAPPGTSPSCPDIRTAPVGSSRTGTLIAYRIPFASRR